MWPKAGEQDWVEVPIYCRDGLKLKSKEDRESKTLEDMLCFTKVHVLCLSFLICKVVLQKPSFYPLEQILVPIESLWLSASGARVPCSTVNDCPYFVTGCCNTA